jgi:hypothetical protein
MNGRIFWGGEFCAPTSSDYVMISAHLPDDWFWRQWTKAEGKDDLPVFFPWTEYAEDEA